MGAMGRDGVCRVEVAKESLLPRQSVVWQEL